MKLFTPTHWSEYELIDSGDFEKLERFGSVVTIRPEPQAIWDKTMKPAEWQRMATVTFEQRSSNAGVWSRTASDEWQMRYEHLNLGFRCRLTSFKHVGVFPEQAVNWDYISDNVRAIGSECKFLNLFAYTGIASVAARMAGAQTTHVDSVKQVVNWAADNLQLSGGKDIRWIVEDARKFVEREIRRGNTYNGIILDPPAFGRGANGESWKLEDDVKDLLKSVAKLLNKDKYFLILNTYSLGFSYLIIENLINEIFKDFASNKEYGEIHLTDRFGKKLPLGVLARFSNVI